MLIDNVKIADDYEYLNNKCQVSPIQSLAKKPHSLSISKKSTPSNNKKRCDISKILTKDSSTPVKNRAVISKCLGLETSRIPRKEKRDRLSSNSILNIINKSNVKLDDSNAKCNIKTLNFFPDHTKTNEITSINKPRLERSNTSTSILKNSKDKSKGYDCFVIFNKSHIPNLKRKVDRYESKTPKNEISCSNNDNYILRNNRNYNKFYNFNTNKINPSEIDGSPNYTVLKQRNSSSSPVGNTSSLGKNGNSSNERNKTSAFNEAIFDDSLKKKKGKFCIFLDKIKWSYKNSKN